jgi:pimeloyl-ACP methyl ester carboxylesterase
VFVASPSYPEKDYDFAAYHMGGVIENLVLGKPRAGSSASVLYLDDSDIRFDVNPRRAEWLFPDFDRLFASIRDATGSSQRGYDMFGHSAGAQILHRHVLFCPESRARRIVAANAGLYTQPDLARPQPIGLAGTGIDAAGLRRSLSRELTVLLGESDNDGERGGMQLHTPLIDQTGANRLDRGRYFHAQGAERARALNTKFNWTLRTVPDVGHDFRGMTRAAAELLYG